MGSVPPRGSGSDPSRPASPRAGTAGAVRHSVPYVLPYAVLFAVWAAVLLVDVHLSLLAGVNDDAGYYFRIARNAALGHPFTFDGRNPTNGFNPLLQALCAWAFRLAGPEDVLRCYRLGVGITIGFAAGAFVLFARLAGSTLRPEPDRAVRAWVLHGVCAVFFAWILLKEYYGLDAFPALFFELVLLSLFAAAGPAPTARRAFGMGLAALGACWSRLDALSFATAFLLVLAAQARHRPQGARAALAYAAPWVLGTGAFLILSWHRFGIAMPVSAVLKTSFPVPHPVTAARTIVGTSSSGANSAVFYAAFLAAAVLCGVLLRRWRSAAAAAVPVPAPAAFRAAVPAWALPLSLYIVMHSGYFMLFSRFDFQGGYVLLSSVYLLLLCAWWAAAAGGASSASSATRRGARRAAPPQLRRAAGAVLVTGGVLVAGVRIVRLAGIHARHVPDEYTIGRELETLTRPDDVLFGEHYGLVGLFTGRVFINGDGVVNSPSYLPLHAARGAPLADYFDRQGVTCVFGNPAQRGFQADAAPPDTVHLWPKSVLGRLLLARRHAGR